MRFSTLFVTIVGMTGIFAHPEPAHILEPSRHSLRGEKPSKLWPKPLQDDWHCMKEEGVLYPQVQGDWSRKKEGIFTAWGFSSTCCKPFAEAWAKEESRGKTRGIHAEFSNTKGGDNMDCDKVVMSHIKKYHWPYLNRFWKDFGVVPEKK